MSMKQALSVLVSADPNIVNIVTASAAAAGIELEITSEPEVIRKLWRDASTVFVGLDCAQLVAAMGLLSKRVIHLVGENLTELALWSAQLAAAVIRLPDTQGALIHALQHNGSTGEATTVWVTGATGGLGCSTFTLTLAALAVKEAPAAVMELDPLGGADLICGAEQLPGWRWPQLGAASGQLDELTGRVPQVAGIDLVAVGREYYYPNPEAIRAVAGSFRRSHNMLLLDGGPQRPPISDLRVLLVVGADVRSVAAARSFGSQLELSDAELVVRVGAGRNIDPQLVAETLRLPLLGVIPQENKIPRLLEAGRLATQKSRYQRCLQQILQGLK